MNLYKMTSNRQMYRHEKGHSGTLGTSVCPVGICQKRPHVWYSVLDTSHHTYVFISSTTERTPGTYHTSGTPPRHESVESGRTSTLERAPWPQYNDEWSTNLRTQRVEEVDWECCECVPPLITVVDVKYQLPGRTPFVKHSPPQSWTWTRVRSEYWKGRTNTGTGKRSFYTVPPHHKHRRVKGRWPSFCTRWLKERR